MTTTTNTTPATETVATTTAAVAAPAVPKAPSKKSLALAIFQEKMTERVQGLFASNKEFRAAVLTKIQADLGVSVASAATMYNSAKGDAEAAAVAEGKTVGLGRDSKKEKAPSTGKRGRPATKKDEAVASTEASPVDTTAVAPEVVAEAPVAEAPVAEATAA